MLLRQPQHGPLHIKRSDPITKGLRIALVGTSGLNVADGRMLTKIGTVDQAITPHGVAHKPLVNSVAGWQYDQEISGAVSIHAIIARAGDTTTDDANKVQAVVTNKTAGQSTRWEFNLGNGFGPGVDKNKPRFSTEAVGIGSVYYDGVLQSGNNPVAVALSNNVFYGITAVEASGANASGSGKTNLFTQQDTLSLNGYCPLILVWDRALNANEIGLIAANPWRVFVDYADAEVLKSSAGGATVITCNTGTATTAGIVAGISSATTIACTPGGATTAGITAGISAATTIACNVGNASTAGISAGITQAIVITCNAGTATPAGVSASISLDTSITITCNAGNATTAGISAVFPQTISCTPGNATTAGVTAGIAGATTISCNVGNASVAGITAGISSAITISCNAGNATTAGISAIFPQTLSCTPGNATTAGISAIFPQLLSCNVGNATTAGITAQVDIAGQIVISCNAGTATTAGVSANISSAFVLTCNAGTATTLGTTAYFPQSLQCNPGNAIALGIDATFTVAGPTTIVCNVGNATASGVQASIYNPGDVFVPGPRQFTVASELRGFNVAIEIRQRYVEEV